VKEHTLYAYYCTSNFQWQAVVNYLSPVRTCNNVEATLSTAILYIERFFRQSRMLLWHCCHFWQQSRTKFRPFDKVKTKWTCSICFDFVERTKSKARSTLATMSKQHCRCLLLWHCCWGGQGFTGRALDLRSTGGELRCITDVDDTRRQRPLLVWPPTLCVSGLVINKVAVSGRTEGDAVHRSSGSLTGQAQHWCSVAWEVCPWSVDGCVPQN